MHVDLLVLLKPGVGGVPVKRYVAFERGQVAGGIRIAPGEVVGNATSGVGAPVHRWRSTADGGLLHGQQVHAHVPDREPVDGRALGLVGQQHALAVREQLVVKVRPHSSRTELDVHAFLESRPLWGGAHPRLALGRNWRIHTDLNRPVRTNLPSESSIPAAGYRLLRGRRPAFAGARHAGSPPPLLRRQPRATPTTSRKSIPPERSTPRPRS